ncbi:MAG: RsmE family RNA methyltransferase, partial [Flavisolibacter sp.]
MSLPFFYIPDLSEKTIVLDEDNSKHIISVLRMSVGEELLFTDGKGTKAKARIINDNRKKCIVEISSSQIIPQRKNTIAIGISLIKNVSRFEWFLEKATEIGVGEIIPLLRAPKPVAHPLAANFEGKIELLGYDLSLPQKDYVGPGQTFTVT